MSTRWMVAGLLLVVGRAEASGELFNEWPADASPQVIGQRVVERFLSQSHRLGTGPRLFRREGSANQITYPDVCTWYGALRFAKETKNSELAARLAQRFEPLFGADAPLLPLANHVDNTVFAAVPLELYLQTKDPRYLTLGLSYADDQWTPAQGRYATPEARDFTERGLSWQTRFWIDDMFMITMVQAQAFRATGDRTYIDRAANEMVVYLDALQRPDGLFFHAPDVPFFWGRGNGWMAAGMAELLLSLPLDNPDRPRILAGYQAMMASLLRYQDQNGMWRQILDDEAAWPETSGSAMFTFAFITGVKKGWLDRELCGTAARKGWLALITYLDENSDLRDVCEGTNKLNDRQYYLDRKRITGDLHGQAPVLWCAVALLSTEEGCSVE